ncbi:branched-chain amino acid ABC transporter permease [Rhodococcus sp. TAF43]|uniref:branched-chain amino acid ABC transporter permease n=1 Tax=Rhodococcus sp. TAF43 TaxID=3237483 RepID=UPI003F99BEE7
MLTDTSRKSESAAPARSARTNRSLKNIAVEVGITLAVVAGVLLWMGPSLYRQDLVFLAATYSLIALGMYIPFVMAGSLSMAYSAYAAIGAYAVALISVKTGLSMWWGWVIGSLVAAVVAVILALATQKLSGFYLAAVTLLFGIAFEHWLIDGPSFTGGSAGISGVEAVTLFGWQPPRYTLVVLAILFVCAIAVIVDRLRTSVWGLTLRAARDNKNAARSSGVNPAHLTVIALAIGAAIASTGGSLFTVSVQAVTPETFTLSIVFLAIFMPIIGGRNSAWGAPLGALIVVIVTLNMPGYQGSGELLLAIAVLLILVIAPGGVIGWVSAAFGRLTGSTKSGSVEEGSDRS